MPVLLYYVAESSAPVPDLSGVGGAQISSAGVAGLKAVYSRVTALPEEPSQLAQQGVLFFHVQQAGFGAGSIVPFRFPTLFADDSGLSAYIESHTEELTRALDRVNAMSQFDIRITADAPSDAPQTGTQYLRGAATRSAALRAAESEFRELLSDTAKDWVVRHDQDRTLLHVLVPRAAEQLVAERFRALTPPAGCRMVILGPWPPGAFVQSEQA